MKIILVAMAMTLSTFAAEESWDSYLTDSCNKSNDRGHYQYQSLGFNRCHDGSASFEQHESSDWEGRCGHTMAANMLYTICNKAVHPVNEFGRVFSDIGAGTSHRTVTSGLNIIFGKHFQSAYFFSNFGYQLLSFFQVGGWNGEGKVGETVNAGILNDHVDIN